MMLVDSGILVGGPADGRRCGVVEPTTRKIWIEESLGRRTNPDHPVSHHCYVRAEFQGVNVRFVLWIYERMGIDEALEQIFRCYPEFSE